VRAPPAPAISSSVVRRRRRRHRDGEQLARIEAEVQLREPHDAFEHQARGGQQHDGGRELADD